MKTGSIECLGGLCVDVDFILYESGLAQLLRRLYCLLDGHESLIGLVLINLEVYVKIRLSLHCCSAASAADKQFNLEKVIIGLYKVYRIDKNQIVSEIYFV